MKLIFYFYVCVFIAVLIAISTISLSHDLKLVFGIVNLVPCSMTIPVMWFSAYRLTFYSNKDWLEKSAEKIKKETYPGIPLAVSGNQESARDLRNLVTDTFMYSFGSVIFLIITFYFLIIC